jgi:hypothetical protein
VQVQRSCWAVWQMQADLHQMSGAVLKRPITTPL